jgi:hypothetical protein
MRQVLSFVRAVSRVVGSPWTYIFIGIPGSLPLAFYAENKGYEGLSFLLLALETFLWLLLICFPLWPDIGEAIRDAGRGLWRAIKAGPPL